MSQESGKAEALEALRQGRIVTGERELRFGATIEEVSAQLGIEPTKVRRRWERDGFSFQTLQTSRPVLWYGRGRVTLTFRDGRLLALDFGDRRWKRAKGWDDYDYEVDVQSFRDSRAELESALGKPKGRSERSKLNLWARWDLGGVALRLHCESRTPSVGLSLLSTETAAPKLPAVPPRPKGSRKRPKGLAQLRPIFVIRKKREGCDQLGGQPPSPLAGRWPRCTDCGSVMSFVAFFWAHAEHLPLREHAALALFLCNRGSCDSFDPGAGANAALLLRAEELQSTEREDLPAGAPSPLEQSRLVYAPRKRIRGKTSRWGGEPSWLQAPQRPCCSTCDREMSFVAQIDGSLHDALCFGDGGSGYLFACPEEHGAAFLWQE